MWSGQRLRTDAPPELSEPAITSIRRVFIPNDVYRFTVPPLVSYNAVYELLGQKPVML